MDHRSSILVCGALTAGFVAVFGCEAQEPKSPEKPPVIRNLPENLAPTMPSGSAAIVPRTTATPAFTLDDAKEYVASHHLPMAFAGDKKPEVIKAEFLTSKQVSDRLNGLTTGFPDNYAVCYVELQGPVTFSGPQGSRVTYNRGVLIFDAHTGNLVIGGGIP
jgi:hypothetical protein